MSPTVYLATCAALPDGDEDGGDLLAACRSHGLDASWQVWDSPGVHWPAADLTVVRSTWDYTTRRAEFLRWTRSVPRLVNPAAVVEWNSDKRYLADLERDGVPIVPTAWVEPGDDFDVPRVGEFVIKPAVGAGSMGAARFDAADATTASLASAHIGRLHAEGQVAMIQPYLADVDHAGETALVFIGGRFSHAIRKGAMLGPAAAGGARLDDSRLYRQEHISTREPDPGERCLAERVLAASPAGLVYARVDLLPSPTGPVLIELELIEPSLFLGRSAGASSQLATAIALAAAR